MAGTWVGLTRFAAALTLLGVVWAQGPVREYIRFGGRVIAIESGAAVPVVTPATETASAGQTKEFRVTAGVTGRITWTVTSGTLDFPETGVNEVVKYTAPSSIPQATTASLKACVKDAPTVCSTVTINLTAGTAPAVAINPPSLATINAGRTSTISATVSGVAAGTRVVWTLPNGASDGGLSVGGTAGTSAETESGQAVTYTAPATVVRR